MRTPNSSAAPPTMKINGPDAGLPATARHSLASTPVPLRPTDSAFPRVRGYELIAVVGCGGMGIVYEARHRELNRHVAIKTLKGEAPADPEFRDRFQAEAEAIARLQHPNVIQVFEVGTVEPLPFEASPSPFIALEFVDGGSLADRTRAPQQPQYAARMVETLARAAHAAHQLGVIHRDLKPANVLLTRAGEPKIADFGIAKQTDATGERAVTRAGTVMGTPEYMAPEQLDGKDATPAIDVYALGVMLYQLLTARVPFQGTSFADTMRLATRQEPVPPRRLQPGVPRDLETICLKCLEKTPGKRYESAEALADDLGRWAAGRPIRARAVGPIERAWRWAWRNPAVAALSVAVVMVATTGLAGVAWKWQEARRNADNAENNAEKYRRAADDAKESAEGERWERYRLSVEAASGGLRLHDSNAARVALAGAPEKHRDWVWHMLHAQLDRSQTVLRGSGNPTAESRFSPDGRWVALRGRDGTRRVWDTVNQKEYGSFGTDRSRWYTVVSDDGTLLAHGTDDHSVVLRDVSTGAVRQVLRGHTSDIDLLSFTADGSRLVSSAADFTARVWDVNTGTQLTLFRTTDDWDRPLLVSPDARFVTARRAEVSDLRMWEMATGREVAVLRGHTSLVLLQRFNPTGDRLATVEFYPSNVIRLWDVPSGRLVGTFRGHDNQVNELAFSADGKRMASVSLDRSVRLWDIGTGPAGSETRATQVLKGHTGGVTHAAFSSDGRRVVSCAHDRTLRYWNAQTGDEIAVLAGHEDDVDRLAFHADGRHIASVAADGTVRLWDVDEVERGYAIPGHSNFVYGTAFHPDNRRVVSAGWDGTTRVWDATTGAQLMKLNHGPLDIVSAVAVHPNGRWVATLARKDELPSPKVVGGVHLWDIETGALLHLWPLAVQNWRDGRIAFSPTGDRLAAGCADGHVRVWDVATRREVADLAGHDDGVRDVAFSPDGRWLASGAETKDSAVRVWDLTGAEPPRVLRGHTQCVYAVAWNPAGTLVASASTDGDVCLWDTTTWNEVGRLRQGTKVYGVAFSPDGKLLAVACANNLVRIWAMETRQEIAELSGHKQYVHHLAFSPDGTRLVTGSGDHTLRVWDSLPKVERMKR